MIFRLRLTVYSLDANAFEHLANARPRPTMEKTRYIIRRIGEKLAAPEPNEQSEMLPCRSFGIRLGRSRRERSVRKAQGSPIPPQMSQLTEHLGIGAAQQ